MITKTFIIAAATGLSLMAALPASAHHMAAPKAKIVNQYKHGHVDRQVMPLREIFRLLRRMEWQEWRRGHGRRHYRHDRRRRHHRRHHNHRRYY